MSMNRLISRLSESDNSASDGWNPLSAISTKRVADILKQKVGISGFSASSFKKSSNYRGEATGTASFAIDVPKSEPAFALAFSEFNVELVLVPVQNEKDVWNINVSLRWKHPSGGSNGNSVGTIIIDQSDDKNGKVQWMSR